MGIIEVLFKDGAVNTTFLGIVWDGIKDGRDSELITKSASPITPASPGPAVMFDDMRTGFVVRTPWHGISLIGAVGAS